MPTNKLTNGLTNKSSESSSILGRLDSADRKNESPILGNLEWERNGGSTPGVTPFVIACLFRRVAGYTDSVNLILTSYRRTLQ
jgi:hypothetical protein